jgi:hypothetical protein
MRRLLTLLVVLAILGVCAPSYGYILVYKLTGTIKAVEWNDGIITNVSVKGYAAVDINDVNEAVDGAEMVLYGKDTNKNLKYYDDTLGGGERANLDTTGDVIGVDIWNYEDPFTYEFTLIGKVKDADVGFGTSDKRTAASSLTGSFNSWWGQLLDDTQDLFGSGTATVTLDTKNTKAANAGSTTVGAIIADFIAGLEDKGYSEITLPL